MDTHLPVQPDRDLGTGPEFLIYAVTDAPLEIIPGRAERGWMDRTSSRFAYRCLPMTIANCSGWEIVSPCAFKASWNGGQNKEAVTVRAVEDGADVDHFAGSHFGHGILTIRSGHLFRTSPGWGTWVRGSPNHVVEGIQPLDGLVETDWLPMPFTINWRFSRPGTIVFGKGAPLAFVTPIPHLALDAIGPELRSLDEDPELAEQYRAWKESRVSFNEELARRDPQVVQQGWQRHYTQGRNVDGTRAPDTHRSRRRLQDPRPASRMRART